MDWNQWNKAVEQLDRYNIKPLLGVIPDCEDPDLQIERTRADFWEYIKELQSKGYKVAMHGYKHVYDTLEHGIVNRTLHSEFAGHSFDEQYEKIKKGKKILSEHGIETDAFFAPAHTYDINTLKALAANGFRYLLDGKSSKPFYRRGILCLPCRSSGCPCIKGSGYYMAVFHAHEWIRQDKAYGYIQLKKLCENCSDEIASWDKYVGQPIGNPVIQVVDEKLYLFYEYSFKPLLRPIVRRIRKLRS